MTKLDPTSAVADWVRLGILFGSRRAPTSPDLERLLLETAQLAPDQPRLFYWVVTWLTRYSGFVARHRLKRLVRDELEPAAQPALAAMLVLAVKHQASRELLIAAQACQPADIAGPLFNIHRRRPALNSLIHEHACPDTLPWKVWVPDQAPNTDALRPAQWILDHNPDYLWRIIRKGDLRATILLTLSHDTPDGQVDSEVALAELCDANRIAIRKALDDLEQEGHLLRHQTPGVRNIRIALSTAKTSHAAMSSTP